MPPPGAGGPFAPAGAYGPPPGYGFGGPFVEKAGFWVRFASYLIDSIVVGLFSIPAQIVIRTGPTEIERCNVNRSGDFDPSGSVQGLCEVPTGGTWAIFAVLSLIAFVAGIVYYAKLEGGSGQTLGKRALGIRVVDARTGGPIGTGRGVGRYFARLVSFLVCLLGYLWMLWDPEKQTWHDKMVNCYVVKT